jgi:Na+-driven multidrug efflux pump
VKNGGPAALSFFLQYLVEVINMFYLGNIDTDRLNGIGLGNSWSNVIGLSVGWGLSGGLDTLCS